VRQTAARGAGTASAALSIRGAALATTATRERPPSRPPGRTHDLTAAVAAVATSPVDARARAPVKALASKAWAPYDAGARPAGGAPRGPNGRATQARRQRRRADEHVPCTQDDHHPDRGPAAGPRGRLRGRRRHERADR